MNKRNVLENLETGVNVGLGLTKATSIAALGIGAGTIATYAWIESKHGTLPKSTYVKAKNFAETEKSIFRGAAVASLILSGLTIAVSYAKDKYINKNKKTENDE